ncbi:LysR family transcriptional regulator [Lichenicola cladoniae]|uniref:LysR family transcriptional regulator n=1 Tax=Lichenicola cladoniae TaxID=1484109 RepID=A0A6M8HSB0_9PROT|nr:LysR family transcriptional regulator [Lichenicola cladoniae]NPD65761.1 LysR family transcriptional regulator [Acetobacteraceae bacterium]QKE91222.1 LysR family transcriptional regulator [Lichenicola cladoniae]
MSTLPDLEAWAIFARVAETGSFAVAAAELGLSTATVSKAVARLEQRIGGALLSRTSRRLALTTLGDEIATRALRLLTDAEALEADMLDRTAQPKGLVRMAVPMSFGQQQVAPLLPGLLLQYPQISIDLHLGDEVVDLVGGGFDFALRIARLENSSLRARRICNVRLMLVASPLYVAMHGLPAHPLELQDRPCFGYAYQPTANRWAFTAQEGEQVTVHLSGPLRSNNGDSIKPALLSGIGLAALPDFLIWSELQEGRLIEVLPDWALPTVPLSLVTPPASLRPARVTVTMDFLHDALIKAPWAAAPS